MPEAFTQREFRNALSAFATGVTIITSCDQAGEPIGMTASSFNTLSLAPPLILWSVTKHAYSAKAFRNAPYFAVHILAIDQIELSNRFARAGEDKFGQTPHEIDANGVPLIGNCAARLDCKQWQVHDGGDHWLIIGEVVQIANANRQSLIFAGGAYASAANVQPTTHTRDSETVVNGPIDSLLFYHISRAYQAMSAQFHQAVAEAGLSIREWRILASLYGPVSRALADLSERTYIQPDSLLDLLHTMQNQNLCRIEFFDANTRVHGTQHGHERVAHLFDLAQAVENQRVPDAEIRKSLSKMLLDLVRRGSVNP